MDLNTDGNTLTSILDVTRRDQPFACFRLKMVTALVDILNPNGHLKMRMLKTVKLCCLTYQSAVTFLPSKQDGGIYDAALIPALALRQAVTLSFAHCMNHLMVKEIACHGQMNPAMKSLKMLMASICSQTREMEHSKLLNWKYGQ